MAHLPSRFALAATLPVLLAPAPAPRPALDGDFADPFVLANEGEYWAYATGAAGTNLQVAQSRDLATWSRVGDALPRLPTWAKAGPGLTWAPSVLRRGGAYVLYYTTRDARSGFQCISRATSDAPAGPFVDASTQPLVCQVDGATSLCGSIDPSPFVGDDGRAYLLWKSDENAPACRRAPRIWAQALTDDGLALTGSETALLAMDRAWETPIVEGPSMVKEGGAYFLFYSASDWESARYAIGYATCDGPTGPCAKITRDAPFVKSAGDVLGPGGQEIFRDVNGRAWMAFHAWTAPHASYAAGGARSLRIAPLGFVAGAPVLGAM
jgi:beta-xylosidase